MKSSALILSYLFFLLIPFQHLASQDKILKVWPEEVPGSIEDPEYNMESILRSDSILRVSKVTDPVLNVFLPPAEKAKGTAVIICPGGGYSNLSVEKEGYDIASWLNDHGIAGIVLKYRLPHDAIMEDKSIGPLQDAQEAIRMVRRNAGKWGINPGRIGIMGFSAGGHLASTASTHFEDAVYPVSDNTSARPDFSILVYPVISFDSTIYHGGSSRNLIGQDPSPEMVRKYSNELQVDGNTPPAFLVHSIDDSAVTVENSIRYMEALKKHSVITELHLYQGGKHGFGLGKRPGATESSWTGLCINWLQMNGFTE